METSNLETKNNFKEIKETFDSLENHEKIRVLSLLFKDLDEEIKFNVFLMSLRSMNLEPELFSNISLLVSLKDI